MPGLRLLSLYVLHEKFAALRNGVQFTILAFKERRHDPVEARNLCNLSDAFSTVLGWSFYGTKSCEYLFGTKATIVYKVIFVVCIVFGATMSFDLAWAIADTLNALMAIPNLIGVLALSGTVFAITKNYLARKVTKTDEQAKPMLSFDPVIQEMQEKALSEEE